MKKNKGGKSKGIKSVSPTAPTLPVRETVTVSVQRPPIPQENMTVHPDVNVQSGADLARQYLAATIMAYMPFLTALPNASDDLSAKFGVGIYEQMMTDSEVSAALDVLVFAVASTTPQVVASLSPASPEYKEAEVVAQFIQKMVDGLAQPLSDTLRILVRQVLGYGTTLAELNFEIIDGLLYCTALNLTDIDEFALVVDGFNTLLGIAPIYMLPHMPIGSFLPVSEGQVLHNVLPREKFLVLSWQPHSDDPRGSSLLRPAYAPWWAKQQILNEMVTWFSRFAQPSIWGSTAPDAQDICINNPDGSTTTLKPTDQLLDALKQFRSASAIAVPAGTIINAINSSAGGEIFLLALDWADKSISRAILKEHLATGEGQHQARASSEVHQDVLGLMILTLRNWMSNQIRRDVFRPVVIANFGKDKAHLTPFLDLGDGDGFPISPVEAANLAAVGWFTPDQMAVMDKRLGLPVRAIQKDVTGYSHATTPVQAPNQISQATQPVKQTVPIPPATTNGRHQE